MLAPHAPLFHAPVCWPFPPNLSPQKFLGSRESDTLKEFEATSRAKMAAMLEEDLEAIISIDFGPLMRKQIRQIPSILQKVIDLKGEIAN